MGVHTISGDRSVDNHILSLLVGLPPEKLTLVEQFVKSLHQQNHQGRTTTQLAGQEAQSSFRYPTVPLPASFLHDLIGLMPPVGGDALADTEALYDEA